MTAMTLRSQFALATLSILATAALAATAAEARPGQGHRPQAAPVVETLPQVDLEGPAVTVETPEVTIDGTAPIEVTTPETDTSTVSEPTADNQNLPPGLQRRVDSGRGLPPGLQNRE